MLVLVGLAAFVLNACGIGDGVSGAFLALHHPPAYDDTGNIVMQICLPDKVVSFTNVSVDLKDTPPEPDSGTNATPVSPYQGETAIVRKWVAGLGLNEAKHGRVCTEEVMDHDRGHAIHVPSLGSGCLAYMIGDTVNHQPVYEELKGREWDTLALAVILSAETADKHESIHYWYKLPPNLSHDHFTNWVAPVSQEGKAEQEKQIGYNSTDMKLMAGKEINYYPVKPDAPKVRFKIMDFSAYYDSKRFWQREFKALYDKNLKDLSEEQRDKVAFVSILTDPIPRCDSPGTDLSPQINK